MGHSRDRDRPRGRSRSRSRSSRSRGSRSKSPVYENPSPGHPYAPSDSDSDSAVSDLDQMFAIQYGSIHTLLESLMVALRVYFTVIRANPTDHSADRRPNSIMAEAFVNLSPRLFYATFLPHFLHDFYTTTDYGDSLVKWTWEANIWTVMKLSYADTRDEAIVRFIRMMMEHLVMHLREEAQRALCHEALIGMMYFGCKVAWTFQKNCNLCEQAKALANLATQACFVEIAHKQASRKTLTMQDIWRCMKDAWDFKDGGDEKMMAAALNVNPDGGLPMNYQVKKILSALAYIPKLAPGVDRNWCRAILLEFFANVVKMDVDSTTCLLNPWSPDPVGCLNIPTASLVHKMYMMTPEGNLQNFVNLAAFLLWRIGCGLPSDGCNDEWPTPSEEAIAAKNVRDLLWEFASGFGSRRNEFYASMCALVHSKAWPVPYEATALEYFPVEAFNDTRRPPRPFNRMPFAVSF